MSDINFVEILDNFHFIRPWFLLAIVPLFLMLLLLRRQVRAQSGWQGILASHLYDNLVSTEAGQKSRPPWLLLFAGWLLMCLALAGPTWEKLPQPVYQVSQGKVILMDMSMSMRAQDIKPNRLSRVRFKAMDLLAELREGETGLVAYAGDAFVISPLTTDVQNLETLIPSLSPEIMPVQGSDAVYALETTYELLQNAGYQTGDIFWITDGIDMTEVAPIRNLMEAHDFRINIMAVGTEDGAPIKITNGNFLKDPSGAVVIPRLRTTGLESIARSSGGRFVISRPDDADIAYLAKPRLKPQESKNEEDDDSENSFGDQWKEFGPWVLLLLVPIAAYGFRRGVLPVLLLILLFDANTPVYANDSESSNNTQNIGASAERQTNWWNNLWQTPNQQGAESFGEEDFEVAAQQFEDPMWKGLSHFEAGDYQQAAEVYSGMDTPDGNFSLGNALAQTQQYPEAIAAYERALELDPDYPNAAENKQYLEDLMDQQEQQDQQQNSDENQENQDQQDSDQQQDQQGESQENESEQQESESPQQDQQGSEQQNSEQEPQQDQSEQQQEQSEQQEPEQMQDQEDQEQPQQSEEQQEKAEMQQQAQIQEQEELTDEQKEQLQKIENWLRKVPDDPAFLLKRKMLLEQQRRKRQRMPALEQKNW